MKLSETCTVWTLAILLCCGTGFAAETNGSASPSAATTSNATWQVFVRFTKEKYALEGTLAKKYHVEVPARVRDFFVAAQKGEWVTTSNLFFAIEPAARDKSTNGWMPHQLWVPVHEIYGTFELFHAMAPKFLAMFATDIIKDIPPGSIYFGGTDPGRFLVSAFSQSQTEGRPFFTITQNALADPKYLDHVADIYAGKIKVLSTNDSKKAFSDYMADVQARILHDQKHPNEPRYVKPGEDVHVDSSGQVQVSGQVAVMSINALMTKNIFDINPAKEFFVEESFPLDWMFPHLTPFGVIMKINRAEIPELTEADLKQDHDFWVNYTARFLGDWITYDTTVKDVTAFAEKVYLQDDYSDFHGDLDFIHDQWAQKSFSKLRSSIGGVYAWRIGQPPGGGTVPEQYIAKGENQKLLEREADFAFKQSIALCPYSPEAVYRYVQLLVNARRIDDALLVAETAAKIAPEDSQFGYLVSNLNSIKSQSQGMRHSEGP
jgi:hypothetical protein